MNGKRVLITGATAGIGLETAVGLARLGAHVVLVGRSAERAASAADQVRARVTGAQVDTLLADLSSMAQVRALAEQYRSRFGALHVLVNNAGALNLRREVTVDGYERTFATNHLAYFLLTNLLLPALEQGAPAC